MSNLSSLQNNFTLAWNQLEKTPKFTPGKMELSIYTVIAFFLLPEWRSNLAPVCDFICNEWANAWFHSQHYNETSFNELLSSLNKIKCKKAIMCLVTHWLVEESLIDIPRSNQIAERAVKLMEKLREKLNF